MQHIGTLNSIAHTHRNTFDLNKAKILSSGKGIRDVVCFAKFLAVYLCNKFVIWVLL